MFKIFFAASILFSQISFATMTPSLQRGEKLIEIKEGKKTTQVCVIPKHFPDGKYSKDDLEDEQKLCSLNTNTNAVCPKNSSTNPGLEFFEVPEGLSVKSLEQNMCQAPSAKDKKKNTAEKLAKYKLSTSCSYTPSILAYYHVSRILGGAGKVPAAVMRTFDLQNHLDLSEKALTYIRDTEGADAVIYQTWNSLFKALQSGKSSSKKDLLFTDDFAQSYGALTQNPRGEEKYSEMFHSASGGGTRAEAFRDKNPIYALLTKTKAINEIVGQEFNKENLQKVIQMRDVSEFILLDTLLSQEDRFGNIHFVERYVYQDSAEQDSNGNAKVKSKKKMTPEEIKQSQALQVKIMLLKDNDCGVSRENRAKAAGLLNKIAHLSPDTYQRLQKLNKSMTSNEATQFFKEGLMFTSTDLKTFMQNLNESASLLKKKCQEGTLKLDLDLESHFGKNKSKVSCEVN